MATSQKAFDQVRSILGKLDQRIDSLRTGRCLPAGAAAPVPAATVPNTSAPGLHSTVGGPGPIAAPAPAAASPATKPGANGLTTSTDQPFPINPPSRSVYGRATPIRHAS